LLQNISLSAVQSIFSRTGMRVFLLFSVMLLALNPLHAQEQLLNVAKQYLSNKDYEKAAATFKQLVEYNPDDESIFLSYLESLKGIGTHDFRPLVGEVPVCVCVRRST
jgi:tetratricopeptide (TPR) repeat protein